MQSRSYFKTFSNGQNYLFVGGGSWPTWILMLFRFEIGLPNLYQQ